MSGPWDAAGWDEMLADLHEERMRRRAAARCRLAIQDDIDSWLGGRQELGRHMVAIDTLPSDSAFTLRAFCSLEEIPPSLEVACLAPTLSDPMCAACVMVDDYEERLERMEEMRRLLVRAWGGTADVMPAGPIPLPPIRVYDLKAALATLDWPEGGEA